MVAALHQTVLLHEAVDALVSDPHGLYVDGTFGRGGHTRLLLDRLAEDARVVGIDKDPDAVAAGAELTAVDPRFAMLQGSFADAIALLDELGEARPLSGALLDLGVSSPQLDAAARGFSFSREGALDMRMNPAQGESAAAWLAAAPVDEIARVLRDYGEERFARRIAAAIGRARTAGPLTTTTELAAVVAAAHPAWEKGRHPATKTFQAIRIHINNELGDLEGALPQLADRLGSGGRLVVISFHSLEDRIVKRFIRDQARGPQVPSYIPVQDQAGQPRLRPLGKARYPSDTEVAANPRARSAVMRAAQKAA